MTRDELKAYHVTLRQLGFRRVGSWIHPDLVTHLKLQRRPGECTGRTIERLILGESRPRPKCQAGGEP